MNTTRKLTLSALFLALGLLLPFLTMQLPSLGNALLPMHIPVLMCGFVCGWKYGLIVGFITPLLRHLIFTMPPLPTASAMAFELATYGLVTGVLYHSLRKSPYRIYVSLLSAMIIGRVVWGIVSIPIYAHFSQMGTAFTWQLFIGGALLEAIPGIIIQIVLIPLLVLTLEKSGVMKIND